MNRSGCCNDAHNLQLGVPLFASKPVADRIWQCGHGRSVGLLMGGASCRVRVLTPAELLWLIVCEQWSHHRAALGRRPFYYTRQDSSTTNRWLHSTQLS